MPARYLNLTVIHGQYCITVWDNNTIVDNFTTEDQSKVTQQLQHYKSKYNVSKLKNETNLKVSNV